MVKVVTVFGGSGFLGKQVVRVLARAGWRIRVAVRRAAAAYDLKPMGDVGQIQVVRCDVRREGDIGRALDGVTAAVNLVGIMHQAAGESFDGMHRVAGQKIAEACARRGIRDLVQVSALGANPDAASQYQSSKGRAEVAVRRAVPQAVVLRPGVMFGPQDDFFTSLAKQVKMFPVMPSPGGGTTKFQPVYVGDVAAAVARTLGNPASYGQTYELGGPEVFTLKDLVAYVGREILCERPQVWLPWMVAGAIGVIGDLQAVLAPLAPAPLLTTDQVLMLRKDNVVPADAKGLKDLGIAATAVESIVPTYLWRFRQNGQFATA